MKTILKGGRVIDPANGRDGEFDVLIENGTIARIGKNLPVERRGRVRNQTRMDRDAGPRRHPRAPPRTRPGAQGDDRDRNRLGGRGWVYRGRVHAEHGTRERPCRHHRVHSEEGGRGRSRARLSHRRRVDWLEGRAARGTRRTEGRRVRRVYRRRTAGRDGAADAPRARVRAACSACRSSITARIRRSRGTASRTRDSSRRNSACAASPARRNRSWSSATSRSRSWPVRTCTSRT